MVGGATGSDLALLAMAADEGVSPQTREHVAILDLLGVRAGVIALTKVDLVDSEWLSLVEEDVREATRHALPGAPVVATSATTGAGIEQLRRALGDLARAVPARDDGDLFRMPVDRAFSIRGTGTVVTGTVWSGRLTRDETVRIFPGDRQARVRSIQSQGAHLDMAAPGTRAAIALAGVDVADVARGSVLITEAEWRPTTLARADVVLVPGAERVVRPRTWFRFHVGTAEVGARVVTSERGIDPGTPFAARVILDEPVILRAGDRFILRSSAPLNTLGGGTVTDPYGPRRAKPWNPGLSSTERLRQIVAESGAFGVSMRELAVRLGGSESERRLSLEALDAFLTVHGDRVVARSVIAELEASLVAAANAHHSAQPLDYGAPLQLIRSRLRASADLIDLALSQQIAQGTLQLVRGSVARCGWEPTPTPEQATRLELLGTALAQAGSEPPAIDELNARFHTDAEPLLRFLERRGTIVQVEAGRYYDSVELKRLIEALRTGMSPGRQYTPADLREMLGFSRKFLIPLLEYCDQAGYTARGVNGRVWCAT